MNATNTITSKEVVDEVRRLSEEFPDKIGVEDSGVVGCRYVYEGRPSCIVGHALWNLGAIDARLEDQHIANTKEDAKDILATLGVDSIGADLEWLLVVQREQDDAMPWADAVRVADNYYR